jgi:hypothetical protein
MGEVTMSGRMPFTGSLAGAVVSVGLALAALCRIGALAASSGDVFNGHKVILDSQGKIIPCRGRRTRHTIIFRGCAGISSRPESPRAPVRPRDPPIRNTTFIVPTGAGSGYWSPTRG